MTLLLGFAPLVVFFVLERLSVSLALWAAFATAFALSMRTFIETGILKLFDAGGTLIFGLLALFTGFIEPGMDYPWVAFILDLGLLGIVGWSLAARVPFTWEYSREQIPQEKWATPLFVATNYRLTWAWAGAFAVMAAADATVIFLHRVEPSLAAAASLLALMSALAFTWQSGVRISRRLGKTPY
ncbi:MAG: hypothetical protein KGL29_03940 [Alphaproteobacteria bacterium]|nr:hypothetical protein [Alphaproteobacteria bacterium]MDE2163837.1 hypothetical protein [Alphaproteobacteria bacterium]MDE2265026.1 hypothetical protein [Alphaproteobacteria bacterium]MDE2498856.1 hypothetical protein [Alphaproteobacteria bacterium]